MIEILETGLGGSLAIYRLVLYFFSETLLKITALLSPASISITVSF